MVVHNKDGSDLEGLNQLCDAFGASANAQFSNEQDFTAHVFQRFWTPNQRAQEEQLAAIRRIVQHVRKGEREAAVDLMGRVQALSRVS